ncbi:hypothetical protein LDENG_00230190, partial [Lucifuga dentata]
PSLPRATLHPHQVQEAAQRVACPAERGESRGTAFPAHWPNLGPVTHIHKPHRTHQHTLHHILPHMAESSRPPQGLDHAPQPRWPQWIHQCRCSACPAERRIKGELTV